MPIQKLRLCVPFMIMIDKTISSNFQKSTFNISCPDSSVGRALGF